MTSEIDDEATNTMIMLEMEVRKKIRRELMDMIVNPQDDEERYFVREIVNSARREEQLAHMRQTYEAMQSQQQVMKTYNDARGIYGNQISQVWADEASSLGSQNTGIFGKLFGK